MKLVTAAIFQKENTILIARRGPQDKHAGKWEFPGGKVEPGETMEACLKREIQEELGIVISVDGLFGESIYSYVLGTIKLVAFRVTWLSGDLQLADHDVVEWISIKDLLNYDYLPADVPFVNQLMKETN
ncbi:(deoxy)nucleoside triphosphate pyrophosphohydrolase [Paenibacillus illinoisensis]|uniref:(deoxy)nucleoside triphosphate pyrophosphohydrolase n=1 Tax=Paenibacillus illinoisensis TaxID=59845 RepID=UPI003D964073